MREEEERERQGECGLLVAVGVGQEGPMQTPASTWLSSSPGVGSRDGGFEKQQSC